MICKVRNTIEKHRMLENISSVAVGVSGGADSMCLLSVLSKLKDEYGIILKAVHINHGIRGAEALRDENVVRDYCEKQGIELLVFHENIPYLAKEMGIGEEECGRVVRYECFKKAQCDATATAHTLSDSIETMLFNLLRGTGTRGLCGIPAVRGGDIIRPLIDCTREEIENYCNENGVHFVTDSTNLTDDYSRNFIRHNIIGKFSHINENYISCIASALEILKSESSFIQECADSLLAQARCADGYKAECFKNAHEAVRSRAIAAMLDDAMSKSVEKRHVELTKELIFKDKGKIELSKDLYICMRDGIMSFQSAAMKPKQWECEPCENRFITPYGVFSVEKGEEADVKSINAIDADKLTASLKMTSRRQGDRFYLKRRRVTKSLKKLFNEEKIPEEKREEIAVLRCGESIIWLENYGTDGNYMPDKSTKNILIIKKEC